MASAEPLPALPFPQPSPIAPPPLLDELAAREPVTRVRTLVGDEAWLVNRYEYVRELLNDDRLGQSHRTPEHAARVNNSSFFSGPRPELNFDTEFEQQTAIRQMLLPFFAPKQIRKLRPRVEALAARLVLDISCQPPPADLLATLALPLPVLVICELLGVPDEDRDQFRALSDRVGNLNDLAASETALIDLVSYMGNLAKRKRAEPTDDVISELCKTQDDNTVAYSGSLLLFAGYETTVARISLGLGMLLSHGDQWSRLVSDPGLIDPAVEEIVRTAPGNPTGGLVRYARTDIDVGGALIREGDCVLLSTVAANRDPREFPGGEHFDITCTRGGNHLAFGYGRRYCLGAPLARLELRAVLSQLAAQLPGLRLAVPASELRSREGQLTAGLAELSVTW